MIHSLSTLSTSALVQVLLVSCRLGWRTIWPRTCRGGRQPRGYGTMDNRSIALDRIRRRTGAASRVNGVYIQRMVCWGGGGEFGLVPELLTAPTDKTRRRTTGRTVRWLAGDAILRSQCDAMRRALSVG